MQPSLVYHAEDRVYHHDFLLAAMAMKAVHCLHRRTTRTEETLKQVLNIVANGQPFEMPSVGTLPGHPEAEHPLPRAA